MKVNRGAALRNGSVFIAALLFSSACSVMRPDCVVDPAAATPQHGSAACIVLVEGRLLVIRHLESGKLDLPGGRAKHGETAQCTAHRETWEETGLHVRVGSAVNAAGTLFRCAPVDAIDVHAPLEVHWWSIAEVTRVLWVDPSSVRPEEWRYGRPALDFAALPR